MPVDVVSDREDDVDVRRFENQSGWIREAAVTCVLG